MIIDFYILDLAAELIMEKPPFVKRPIQKIFLIGKIIIFLLGLIRSQILLFKVGVIIMVLTLIMPIIDIYYGDLTVKCIHLNSDIKLFELKLRCHQPAEFDLSLESNGAYIFIHSIIQLVLILKPQN